MKDGFFFKALILYTKKEIIMHFSVIENWDLVLFCFFFFNGWEKDNSNPEYLSWKHNKVSTNNWVTSKGVNFILKVVLI